jgi:hypothetical protein
MYSHQDDEGDVDDEEYILFRFYIEIHIRCIFVHPQVKEREKKRVAPLPQRQLNSRRFLSLYSSLQ